MTQPFKPCLRRRRCDETEGAIMDHIKKKMEDNAIDALQVEQFLKLAEG